MKKSFRLAAGSAFLLSLLALAPVTGHAADTYQIDPVHSSILFSAVHLGVTPFYGRFNDASGTVVFDQADPAKSSVEITIPVESLDTHNAKRDQHLKSPDFFNAKQFPVITFKSTKVEGQGDTFTVTGDFTLHGVTKPLTVEFKKGGEGKGMQGETRGGGTTSFSIKRSEFGIAYMPGALSEDVNILLSLEGIKK